VAQIQGMINQQQVALCCAAQFKG